MKRLVATSLFALLTASLPAHDAAASVADAAARALKQKQTRRGFVPRGQGAVRAVREALTAELQGWKAKGDALSGQARAEYQARTRVLARLALRLEGKRKVHRSTLLRIERLSQQVRAQLASAR